MSIRHLLRKEPIADHSPRLLGPIFSSALAITALPQFTLAAEADSPPQHVLIIPHTHWEGAVFKTREEYLEAGLPNIEKALYLLKKFPDYHFVLDQMCYVRPFLERYPSEVSAFRQFLSEGRLQIAGGTDSMNDNNMPSGESIVRQFLLAKTYFRERLAYDVTTGWALDTFGHNAQMPQILRLAGMKSYWFMRGATSVDMPSEFRWQGLDGTQIPAFWLPLTYGPLGEIPGTQIEFNHLLQSRFDSLAPFGHRADRVLLAGSDVSEPNEALPGLVEQFNKSSTHLTAQLAIPADFEALVAKRTDQPVVRGELNPVGQGVYSTRIELKQAMRNVERLLTTAEKLNVIASIAGGVTSPDDLGPAWEALLFNEEHDPMAGSVVDKVYGEEMQDYALARHVADEQIQRDEDSVLEHLDTRGNGIPVAVFNSLGWQRNDVAEVDIPFSEADVHAFALLDASGNVVPIQFLKVLRNGDGGIRQARIAFIARDVPAMGYAIYHAVPATRGSQAGPVTSLDWFFSSSSNSGSENRGAIENEFYRAAFDLRTGALTSLTLKENHWEVLSGPGNVVAREYDGGDAWDLYGTISGDIVTSKMPMPRPRPVYTQWSNDFGSLGTTTSGPVFSEFHTMALSESTTLRPFGKNQFGTRVRVYNDLRRIDIRTELENEEAHVRYRAIFPTTLAKGTVTHEIPFGAIERSQNDEFPAQNWVDYGDGHKGLALLNRGIPGNNVSDGALMLSLMRSANVADWPLVGGNEAGVGSDTGLGIGRTYTLDYALLPHSGDWRSAQLWRAGMEFNNPLIVRTVASHPGELASKWGLLDVSADNVVVSALKPGQAGTVILRVYEAAGKATEAVHVSLHAKIDQIHEANLIEDAGALIGSDGHGFTFELRPFEIKTFKLTIRPML
jgi:alpha-mannosidase